MYYKWYFFAYKIGCFCWPNFFFYQCLIQFQAAFDYAVENKKNMFLTCTYLQKYAREDGTPNHKDLIVGPWLGISKQTYSLHDLLLDKHINYNI